MYRSGRTPNRRWDGVIGAFDEQDDLYESFVRPNRVPAVSLTETALMPCVLPDNDAIGTLGAEHLIELGYKHFAFYFWQSKLHEQRRASALQRRLKPEIHHFFEINRTPTPRIRHQRMITRLGILKKRLKALPKPVAIMAPLDDLAQEIINVCMDLGLKVPEEVGVLGVNNDELICDFAPVQISSVDDDEFKIGYEGAALLGRMMKGRKPPGQPLLVSPKGVVIRKSTDLLDVAKVPDRHVAAAARYIAENFQTNITTQRVAAAAGLSKSALHTRFLLHIGRSVHEQILRKRVELAKKLLRTSNDKTARIADETGFGSRERFSKAFKLATGMNPTAYREKETPKPGTKR
jgi:LacI family transcriptional regulator